MIRKQVYIESYQEQLLKKKSKMTGISEAELVREALEAHLYGGVASGLDLSTWEEEKKFIEQLIEQRKTSDRKTNERHGRTWKRADLYE
jgi:prophage maintenance system killer protein